jgi:hypothetical protein
MNLTESIRNDINIVSGEATLLELEEYFTIPLNEGIADFAKSVAAKVKAKWNNPKEAANDQQLAQATAKLEKAGGSGILRSINKKLGKTVAALGLIVALTTAIGAGSVQAAEVNDITGDYISQMSQEFSQAHEKYTSESAAVQDFVKAKFGVDTGELNSPQQLGKFLNDNLDDLGNLGNKIKSRSPLAQKGKADLYAQHIWQQATQSDQQDDSVEQQAHKQVQQTYQQQDNQAKGLSGAQSDPSDF